MPALVSGAAAGRWWWPPASEQPTFSEPAPTSGPGLATLALVAENITSAIVITDALGRIDWVNEAFTRMTGYTLADALGKRPGRLLQGAETQPADIACFRTGLAGRDSFETEVLNYRRDGQPYLVHIKIDPVFDPAGRLRSHIAIQTDITHRRRQEIMNAEVLAHAAHCIVATDAHGIIEIFNPGAVRLTGYVAGEMIGCTKLTALLEPRELVDHAAELTTQLDRVVPPSFETLVWRTHETGEPEEREWTFRHRDGRAVPVRLSLSAMRDAQGRLTGYLGIASGISAERQAEENRREFDLRLRKIASQVPGMMFQYRRTADGRSSFPYASEGIRDIYGISPAEVKDDIAAMTRAVHPDDRERVQNAIRESALKLDPWLCEYRTMRPDGTARWVLGKAMPEPQANGAFIWHGFITDITAHRQAQEAHEQNRAFLQSIYSSVDLAIFVVEATAAGDFRFVEVNPGFERMTGIISGQICGQRAEDLTPIIPPEVGGALQANFRRCAAADDSIEYEEKVAFSGRPMWWLTRLTPLAHAGGRVVRLVGLAVNITERKAVELRAQLLTERLQLASTAAQIGIWDLDLMSQHLMWDERMHQLYGTAPAQFECNFGAWRRCVHPADMGRVEQQFQAALGGQRGLDTAFRILRGDGEVRTLRAFAHVERTSDGRPRRVVGVNWDITAEQHAQDETLRAKNEAEQLNRLLGDSLVRAKELAREPAAAGGAKTAFLANMSHEIRTPLNAVLGMSSLLLTSDLNPEQHELAETIRSSGDSLLDLLNDILDYSKIDSGHLELERQGFVLRECVESALDVLAGRTAEKKLDLLYWMGDDIPLAAEGDVTRLRQIIVNLLGNAVKFTERGEIFLTVRRVPPTVPGGLRLHLSVHDSGIGIAPERMDRLFKSFSQVDASTTRNYGGTGLGLAICKRLVELMRGRIWVESEAGKGSVFQFEVELAAVAPPAPVAAVPLVSSEESRGRRVLIVDDNPTQCRVLCLQAVTWGLVPRSTTSAREALGWLERGDMFDLALVDQAMPEPGGLEFVTALRRVRAPAQLPVILLTPLGRVRAPEKAGVVGYSSKPIKPRALHALVREALLGQGGVRRGAQSGVDENIARRHPLRLLLVEDNAVNQRVATLMLGKLGYMADVAGNGLAAVAALERHTYDLVFMDLQMPEMDGLQATRAICARWPKSVRPHIVAMTANASTDDREACLAAGMDGFISKPVRLQDLRGVLLITPVREPGEMALAK
ncbi:MAG: PAS domain S-box protein [Undibacterium sp.]|nr:PAS domain S-box protein [Opitutaceae bacterium]